MNGLRLHRDRGRPAGGEEHAAGADDHQPEEQQVSQAQAIVEREEPKAPAPQSERAAMFSLIERMASDPSIDLDRVERVIAMRDQMEARAAEKAFNAAMAQAQQEMGTVAVNANNPQTRSRYASFDQLDRALRPIYTRHGFALSYDEAESPKPDHIRMICLVSHKAGHTRTYHCDMDVSGKGAKGGDVMTKNHAIGAASSYGMRYLLRRIFNVATGEGDTDGNSTAVETITEDQVLNLRDLIEAAGTDAETFCKVAKIETIPDMPAAQYDRAVLWLQKRQNANA